MSQHKLTAGTGYTYLTRQVAAHTGPSEARSGSPPTTRRRASHRAAGSATATTSTEASTTKAATTKVAAAAVEADSVHVLPGQTDVLDLLEPTPHDEHDRQETS